jgi:hypothetical protein
MTDATQIDSAWIAANPVPVHSSGTTKNSRGRVLAIGGSRMALAHPVQPTDHEQRIEDYAVAVRETDGRDRIMDWILERVAERAVELAAADHRAQRVRDVAMAVQERRRHAITKAGGGVSLMKAEAIRSERWCAVADDARSGRAPARPRHNPSP